MTAPNKLPAHIAAMLDLERGAPGMPAEAKSRVLARLGQSLPPTPDSGSEGSPDGGEAGGLPADGAGQAAAQVSAHGGSAASGASSTVLGALAQKPVLLATTMFALGGASGALVYHSASGPGTQPAAVVAEQRPAESPELVAPAVVGFDASPHGDDAGVTIDVSQAVAEAPAGPSRRSPASRSSDERLAAERALIEVARTALARGDSQAALASLQRHARNFSRGQLSEERDALWIRALVIDREFAAAGIRAEKFQTRYPRSLFLPMIRDALAKSRNQP